MLRPCCRCQRPSDAYLHHGKLYCAACLPGHELPLWARTTWAIRRARALLRERRQR